MGMSVDLKQLEALASIADHGSFSAAAAALGTVQSNVSGRIARLETELDTTLVNRSSGTLTEDGEIVVERARRVLAELEAIMADVVSAHSEVVGTVRVGMIGTTGRWLIPALFALLSERHPRIVLRVTEGTSTTLEPQLLTGQLDFAVLTTPVQADELAVQPLIVEDLVLVVPNSHPLAASHGTTSAPLPLHELEGIDLLLPLKGTALRDEIDEAIEPAGIVLTASMELDGLRTLASLVFDGYGPAILPATAVSEHLRDRFTMIELEGGPRRTVGLVSRRHGLPSAPSRVVRELLVEVASDTKSYPSGIHSVGT
jgi:LysR family hydrogen peroxide-inducible transcriptional activator